MMLAAMSKPATSNTLGRALKLHRVCGLGEVSMALLPPETRTYPSFLPDGTRFAISYSKLGVSAQLPCRANGRGGARNRADRISRGLSVAHVGNLLAAARHAEVIGLPFTRMVTIHWQASGVPLDSMAKATGRFVDLLGKALARHGSRTAWLWVHENGDGKGGHCHLLVHVPAALVPVVSRLQKGWLRRITDNPYRKGVIHSKPIGGRLGLEIGNPELHAANAETALAYVLKGASKAAAARFNLQRLEPGGRIVGKRCGTSQNIGPKARKVSLSQRGGSHSSNPHGTDQQQAEARG